MPIISIVLPTYNGEEYIRETIDSILSQTMTDWELIIVDDCSDDSTYEIACEYRDQDSRIRVIQNEVNSKTPTALNNGFKVAKGKYLTWTADDNIYYKNALEIMVNYMEVHSECGLSYCDMEMIDGKGEFIEYQRNDPEGLYYNCPVGGCFIYTRQVLKTVGEYNPEMFLIEDYDYWLRISKKFEIHRIPVVAYEFRIHPGAQTYTRKKEVNDKLYSLRVRELEYLLSKINDDYKEKLFIDMFLQCNDMSLVEQFYDRLPDSLEILVHRNTVIDSRKKYIIFGAGDYGRRALSIIGEENVKCFIDNNPEKIGTLIGNIEIKPMAFLLNNKNAYNVIIGIGTDSIEQIIKQFADNEIADFITYIELLNGVGLE